MATGLQDQLHNLIDCFKCEDDVIAGQTAHNIVGDIGHYCLEDVTERDIGEKVCCKPFCVACQNSCKICNPCIYWHVLLDLFNAKQEMSSIFGLTVQHYMSSASLFYGVM